MTETAILLLAGTIFLWGVVSGRLERADLTAPIVFVATGGLFAAAHIVHAPSAMASFKVVVEVTLVWVLFSDAAGVPFRDIHQDLGRILRLLAVGLPLTVLAGWALAQSFFPQLGVWLALLVGAALAPTDAALGLSVVRPHRCRRRLDHRPDRVAECPGPRPHRPPALPPVRTGCCVPRQTSQDRTGLTLGCSPVVGGPAEGPVA